LLYIWLYNKFLENYFPKIIDNFTCYSEKYEHCIFLPKAVFCFSNFSHSWRCGLLHCSYKLHFPKKFSCIYWSLTYLPLVDIFIFLIILSVEYIVLTLIKSHLSFFFNSLLFQCLFLFTKIFFILFKIIMLLTFWVHLYNQCQIKFYVWYEVKNQIYQK
jgi:hypothetical protein